MLKKIITSGKRKTAVARAVTTEGNGKITINGKPYETLQVLDRLKIEEPVRIAKNVLGKIDFNIEVKVKGGGEKGQVEAARISIARALVAATGSKELEKAFLDYDRNLLVADVRRKEAYKPGDSKARRKRQTSYR
uniref:30S ribosomal protein S9 n=1 Tax=uncultured archaeon Rifle_16ft_4_minimus_37913 TaxID=1665152 RepID=A0A0H4TRB9_9ARCH|nr:30S ribosomal protein S9, small subunit ribosomal protein S9 [uncultured archaeon Rifle_16ft_4_minimus_37913]